MSGNIPEASQVPLIVDLVVSEYRKAIDTHNAALPEQDPRRRDAQAELNQAGHFVAFMQNWLRQRYIVRQMPVEKDARVVFDTGQECRITAYEDPQQAQQAEQPKSTKYVSV